MVGALVGSPQAKGLFHRAIAQSGAWMGLQMGRMRRRHRPRRPAPRRSRRRVSNRSPSFAPSRSTELPRLPGSGLVIDGYLIPEDLSITFANGKQNDVDVLTGSNKDEANTSAAARRGDGRGGAAAAPAPGAAVEAYLARQTQYGELAETFLKLPGGD